jgi:hypothetical protein
VQRLFPFDLATTVLFWTCNCLSNTKTMGLFVYLMLGGRDYIPCSTRGDARVLSATAMCQDSASALKISSANLHRKWECQKMGYATAIAIEIEHMLPVNLGWIRPI